MANFVLRKRINKVKYIINGFQLIEYNMYSDVKRVYDLTDTSQRDVFQAHLKHFSRYFMEIDINSFDLYYLHFLKWL